MQFKTWYGPVELTPRVLELLETKEMKRLSKINQYGAIYQLYSEFRTTRLDHSLGVYALLQKLGATEEEQIAGLLHDISHTAFSHVIDFVLGDIQKEESYHEHIAEVFLQNSEVIECLKKHTMNIEKILSYEKGPSLLERDYPDLCADRLDYLLRDLEVFNLLSEEEIYWLIEGLGVSENRIVFMNKEKASFLCKKAIEGNKKIWNSPYQIYLAKTLSDIVALALKKKYITEKDLLGTDNRLFRELQNIEDKEIESLFENITKEVVVTNNEKEYIMHVYTKPRIIDPILCINGSCQRVSDIDPEFVQERDAFLKIHNKGYFLHVRKREKGEIIQ